MENVIIGFIIPALFVIFGVVPAIVKASKSKKSQQASSGNSSSEEPFAEQNTRSSSATQSTQQARRETSLSDEREREERLRRYREKKAAENSKKKAQAAAKGAEKHKQETHSHVGKAEQTYGETGTENYAGEGCEEHYNLRYITEELRSADEFEVSDDVAYLRSVIVLGEIINEPKYKSY